MKKQNNKKQFLTIGELKKRSLYGKMAYKTEGKRLNKIVGFISVAVGIVTLPLPTGSIFLILGGMGLYSCPFSIRLLLKHKLEDIKIKLGCLLW